MRCSAFTGAAFVYLVFIVPVLAAQSVPQLDVLLRALRSDATSDRASTELLNLARSSSEVRQRLVNELPPLIAIGPRGNEKPWQNAAQLAGSLRIVEAVPALTKWIVLTDGTLTISRYERLGDNIAGQNLARIGDPAIPSLLVVLTRDDVDERTEAIRVLKLIASPRAKDALRTQLRRETDPKLRQVIENALAR